jgi:hypothetical protein
LRDESRESNGEARSARLALATASDSVVSAVMLGSGAASICCGPRLPPAVCLGLPALAPDDVAVDQRAAECRGLVRRRAADAIMADLRSSEAKVVTPTTPADR